MENNIPVIKFQELLSSLTQSYNNHYGLSTDLDQCTQDVQRLWEHRHNNLKCEYLRVTEENLVLENLAKQPEEWSTLENAEADISGLEKVLTGLTTLSKNTDKLQDVAAVASDALDTLGDSLDALEMTIEKLKTKSEELKKLLKGSAETKPEFVTAARKLNELLTTAYTERDILQKRILSLEETSQYFEKLVSAQARLLAAGTNKCHQLKVKLQEIEHLSGLKCRVIDETSFEIYFLPVQPHSASIDQELAAGSCSEDEEMKVLLTFQRDEFQRLDLKSVQVSQLKEEVKDLISQVLADKDIPRLVLGLQKIWRTHQPLVMEISKIRSRHAIDWIPEKSLLLLMPRKSSSAVCALKVPDTYPHSGEIVLENITGHSTFLSPDRIQPPSNKSLTGWALYLESLFTQP